MSEEQETSKPLFSVFEKHNIATLQTTSALQKPIQHTFIMSGSEQSGKSTIISQLAGQNIQNFQTVGLLYSYMKTNIIGQRATLQLYEVSGDQFKHLQLLPLTQASYKSTSFVILVDLAENPGDLLNELQKALDDLRIKQEAHLQNLLSPSQYQELESQVYQRIENLSDRTRMRPFLIPVVIVCTKYDLFAKNLDIEVRKWLSRGLRYLAHTNYASLAFGSQNDLQYIKQALQFEAKQSTSVNMSDHMKQIYITKGSDQIDQIGLPQTNYSISPIDAITKIIKEQATMNPHPQKKKTNKKLFEEDWSKFAEERIDKIKNQKDRENEIE